MLDRIWFALLAVGVAFGAFTDSVVDVEALRRQNERHRALQQALACCARLAADHGYSEFGWDAPESAPLPTQAEETLRPWVMARITGCPELPAAEAAAATVELLGAPDPRLWVGEIT